MPLLSGVEAMRALRAAGHTPPFVLVTTDTEDALEWINLGALAVVNKLNMDAELVTAVKSAAAGFSYLSSHARRPYSKGLDQADSSKSVTSGRTLNRIGIVCPTPRLM